MISKQFDVTCKGRDKFRFLANNQVIPESMGFDQNMKYSISIMFRQTTETGVSQDIHDCYLMPYNKDTGCIEREKKLASIQLMNKSSIENNSFVYNPHSQTIYCLYRRYVKSLNLNHDFSKMNDWNMFHSELDNRYRYNNCVCCMVQDNFIAMIGGYDFNAGGTEQDRFKLFALNCGETVVLKSYQYAIHSGNACAIYHDKLHYLLVHHGIGFNYYDINKDEWMVQRRMSGADWGFGSRDQFHDGKLWISKNNPNVIYFAGIRDAGSRGRKGLKVMRYDIRIQNSVNVHLFENQWNLRDNISFLG